MIAFAQRLAHEQSAKLPTGYDTSFDICRTFLNRMTGRSAPRGPDSAL